MAEPEHTLMLNSCDDYYEKSGPEIQGYLNKWTNYIHGWQPRFIALKAGVLSYYKSEHDSDFGCRGAISLSKAIIKNHDFDECRFDVNVNNCVWYLRADTPEDKIHWIEVLECYKTKFVNNDQYLKRHGSAASLQSNSLSSTSSTSVRRPKSALKERVQEMETFKDIVLGQIDTLQRYFDDCAKINKIINLSDGLTPIDFMGESITFQATTSGILTTLQNCIDIINQQEEFWEKKLQKEIDRRHRSEELHRQAIKDLEKSNRLNLPGPDLEEGPHSTLPEDEFFDAVESELDKIEEDSKLRARLRLQRKSITSEEATTNDTSYNKDFGMGGAARSHRLWPQIENVCNEQLHYAQQGVGESGNGWQLFVDEGDMKMFRREQEVDGLVVDPLKACHVVEGVSAREMCHYFFMPQYRTDWESTLEEMSILENISPDTLVFLQTHKRIWPANQRDALFWSHMRKVDDDTDKDVHDTWMVCNQSTENENYPPPNKGKCLRIFLTVILVCQTYIRPGTDPKNITRNDLTCKITYCSVVNPGGWAPATVLRAIYKREYPKFLKRFTQYVLDQSKNKEIMF